MPIYEYECRKCKAHVEVMQKMADKPLLKCTKCGGRLEKQWSSTSFQLKGTGWYATDYAVKTTETKPETKDVGTDTSKETTSKPDEKADKSESKTGKPKTETTTSEKPSPIVKKTSSKDATSRSGGD